MSRVFLKRLEENNPEGTDGADESFDQNRKTVRSLYAEHDADKAGHLSALAFPYTWY